MKQIKTVIATTLPDQLNSKYTKGCLKNFRDQINSPVPDLPVRNNDGNRIGLVKEATVSENKLMVSIEVDTSKINKDWEYYFVPISVPFEREVQGNFVIEKEGTIEGVQMVKFPTDLSLKPFRFEKHFKEGVDYHIRKYDEITDEDMVNFTTGLVTVYVYYPSFLGAEEIIKNAQERGFLQDEGDGYGRKVFPFEVSAMPVPFDKFKQHIKKLWQQKSSSTSKENPLKNILKTPS